MEEKYTIMSNNDLITPDNLSKELLYSIFESAFMDVSYDGDNDVVVEEDVKCIILFNEAQKDRIRLLTIFGIDADASQSEKLQCVNDINANYVIVRASLGKNSDVLYFDYDISLKGGITKKNFVLTVKRFCSIPRSALSEYGGNIV